MFREITIGQYYPADSLLHRLDPRVKLFFTLFYMIGIFVADNIFAFVLLTVGLFGAVRLSKVPFGYMVKGLQAIILLLIIAGAFNMFLTPGQTLATVGPLTITDVGLKNAGLMTARMIYLIIGTSLMTLTTTPNRLTDGLETSLGPLQKLNVPVHEIALMMSIALRFIPDAAGRNRQDHEGPDGPGRGFRDQGTGPEGQSHGASFGTPFRLCLSPGFGSGHGHGGQMLSRR